MSTNVNIIGEFQNDHGKWLPLNQDIINKFWKDGSQNYTIFCVWAGVRRQIAEERVGHPIPSIAENRGVPVDWKIQEGQDRIILGLGYEPHSLTWMTIAEIVAYDWSILGKESRDLGKKAMEVWPDKAQHNKIRLIMGFD